MDKLIPVTLFIQTYFNTQDKKLPPEVFIKENFIYLETTFQQAFGNSLYNRFKTTVLTKNDSRSIDQEINQLVYKKIEQKTIKLAKQLLPLRSHFDTEEEGYFKTSLPDNVDDNHFNILPYFNEDKIDTLISQLDDNKLLDSLNIAVDYGRLDIVQKLINHFTKTIIENPPKEMPKLKTPLISACKRGYHEIVKALIENNAYLQKLSSDDIEEALEITIKKSHIEVAKVMIENDTCLQKITSRKDKKYNGLNHVLWLATKENDVKLVKTMIENGECLQTMANNQESAYSKYSFTRILELAAQENHVKIVKAMIENDEYFNKLFNLTSVFDIVKVLKIGVENGHTEVVKVLLGNNHYLKKLTSTSIANMFGYLLWLAAQNNYVEIVKALIENSTSLEQIASNRNTSSWHRLGNIFISTAREGHAEVIKAMIENNACFEKLSNDDIEEALKVSVKEGHIEVVKTMVKNNAYLENLSSDYIEKIFYIAMQTIHPSIAKVLYSQSKSLGLHSFLVGFLLALISFSFYKTLIFSIYFLIVKPFRKTDNFILSPPLSH